MEPRVTEKVKCLIKKTKRLRIADKEIQELLDSSAERLVNGPSSTQDPLDIFMRGQKKKSESGFCWIISIQDLAFEARSYLNMAVDLLATGEAGDSRVIHESDKKRCLFSNWRFKMHVESAYLRMDSAWFKLFQLINNCLGFGFESEQLRRNTSMLIEKLQAEAVPQENIEPLSRILRGGTFRGLVRYRNEILHRLPPRYAALPGDGGIIYRRAEAGGVPSVHMGILEERHTDELLELGVDNYLLLLRGMKVIAGVLTKVSGERVEARA